MSYEDIECPVCHTTGQNMIEVFPVKGHPNVESKYLICKCGQDLMEIQ